MQRSFLEYALSQSSTGLPYVGPQTSCHPFTSLPNCSSSSSSTIDKRHGVLAEEHNDEGGGEIKNNSTRNHTDDDAEIPGGQQLRRSVRTTYNKASPHLPSSTYWYSFDMTHYLSDGAEMRNADRCVGLALRDLREYFPLH